MGKVQSGETEVINKKSFGTSWYGGFHDEDVMEWEDFVELPSVRAFLERLDFVPLYKYLVNYTYYWFYKKQLQGEASDEIVNDLVRKTVGEFKKNKMPSAKCKPSYVREMLTTEWSRTWDNFEKSSTERVFDLAFGLNLPVEDVSELLQKAVKRADFNYYDVEELLTYCVLSFQDGNRYPCFQALRKDFEKIEAADGQYTETRKNTEAVGRALRAGMKNSGKIYKDDTFEFENLNENLKFFLAQCKAEVISGRTAARVFQELYNEVVEKYRETILEFKKVYRTSEEFAKTTLEITYDARQEIALPANTIFYAKKENQKEAYCIEFQNPKETVLPRQNASDVMIPIQSMDGVVVEKDNKRPACYIGGGKKLTLQSPETFALSDIKTDRALKYDKADGTVYARGYAKAKALPGTMIPKGTVFLFEEKQCQSTEDVEVKARAVATVDVVCTTPNEPGKKVTEKETITYMKQKIGGIYSITNPKAVEIKEVTDSISKELFREYLYRHNAEDIMAAQNEDVENLLGIWFTETEITSVRFSKIQAQEKVQKKKQAANGMRKNEVRRVDIITLAFMLFCDEILEEERDGSVDSLVGIYQDFVQKVNSYLTECRMMPFYLANPYECFLAFLLKTDEPVDSLRITWEIVRAREKCRERN